MGKTGRPRAVVYLLCLERHMSHAKHLRWHECGRRSAALRAPRGARLEVHAGRRQGRLSRCASPRRGPASVPKKSILSCAKIPPAIVRSAAMSSSRVTASGGR